MDSESLAHTNLPRLSVDIDLTSSKSFKNLIYFYYFFFIFGFPFNSGRFEGDGERIAGEAEWKGLVSGED